MPNSNSVSYNSDSPGTDDLVLGGQARVNGLVLGGLEGVRWRLASPSIEQRVAALTEALSYDRAGLKLIIQALRDEFGQVEEAAAQILRQQPGLDARYALEEEYIPLRSVFGMDYLLLRNYLGAGKWREANEETWRLVQRICSNGSSSWLQLEHLRNFPCQDLQTIDRLWIRHSEGRFGFSVQARLWRQVWERIGRIQNDRDRFRARRTAWERFGDRVGWRVNQTWLLQDQFQFSLDAPEGHLPTIQATRLSQVAIRQFLWTDLFARVDQCRGLR
ncbi:MAG: GUN4 domain-containing protein [Leptolyngbyaceae cyanobacterium bins.59]|nr:GUN4 domain-containing protein [Leptolyngbyaceae cyanobacterium bins.59]